MASSCSVNGVIGLRNGHVCTFGPGKKFWKHEGSLPLQAGDQPVEFFTFGGGASAPLDDGVYFGTARVVTRTTIANDFIALPSLAGSEDDDRMPSPVFVVVGKVSHSNLSVGHNRAFDIDVSQYGPAHQQSIHLRCFYPNAFPALHKYTFAQRGEAFWSSYQARRLLRSQADLIGKGKRRKRARPDEDAKLENGFGSQSSSVFG
ncbi:hypothetical protein J3R83DRAFT_3215 [Lanmaoa asiatica]|nr:hypothetical protein J3R83DRAFT_3215 [Lanmaoa asiatica]